MHQKFTGISPPRRQYVCQEDLDFFAGGTLFPFISSPAGDRRLAGVETC